MWKRREHRRAKQGRAQAVATGQLFSSSTPSTQTPTPTPTCLEGQRRAVEGHPLAVGLHAELLHVGRKVLQRLLVRQQRGGRVPQEGRVPHLQQGGRRRRQRAGGRGWVRGAWQSGSVPRRSSAARYLAPYWPAPRTSPTHPPRTPPAPTPHCYRCCCSRGGEGPAGERGRCAVQRVHAGALRALCCALCCSGCAGRGGAVRCGCCVVYVRA